MTPNIEAIRVSTTPIACVPGEATFAFCRILAYSIPPASLARDQVGYFKCVYIVLLLSLVLFAVGVSMAAAYARVNTQYP